MRKDFGAKTYIYPQPVLIIGTYDENNIPDAMNAAWGGISDEDQISICISSEHKTTKNILLNKAFTVSSATKKYVVECDYFGIESGNKVTNKIEKAKMHATKSKFVNAPIIDELPLSLECELISYDESTCILKGKIVNVSIDDSILNEQNKIDINKFEPISFDPINLKYLLVKDVVGNAFKDGIKIK